MNEELETSSKIPTGIKFIDDLTGGIFRGQIHCILGESGVGKSWLCQRIIKSLLTHNHDASILYSNFSGNLRFNNLKRVLGKEEFLERVNFFHPATILENIILSKKINDGYLPNLSLLIFDTIFGSPMQFVELLNESKKKWERNIFFFMLDLRKIAQIRKIPIIIVHHLFSDTSKELHDKDQLLNPFCVTKSVLHKSGPESSLKFYIYNQYLGSTHFNLFS